MGTASRDGETGSGLLFTLSRRHVLAKVEYNHSPYAYECEGECAVLAPTILVRMVGKRGVIHSLWRDGNSGLFIRRLLMGLVRCFLGPVPVARCVPVPCSSSV